MHELSKLSVTVEGAVKMTGIPRTRLYEMMKTGELRRVKFGKRTLIVVDDLKAAIERATR